MSDSFQYSIAGVIDIQVVDSPADESCSLTATWMGGSSDTFQLPSGRKLIVTETSLRDSLKGQISVAEKTQNMSRRTLHAFHKVLWHAYRDATVKPVKIQVAVLAIGSERKEENVEMILPSGYNIRPANLTKDVRPWLRERGYVLKSETRFEVEYTWAIIHQTEVYYKLCRERHNERRGDEA